MIKTIESMRKNHAFEGLKASIIISACLNLR